VRLASDEGSAVIDPLMVGGGAPIEGFGALTFESRA
jgi:hypothetical protein